MKDPKSRTTPMDIDDVGEIDAGYKLNGEMQKSDARNDKDRLRQNQAVLGVNEEHKTKAMQKHKRGTFP